MTMFIFSAICMGIVFLYGCLGEIITEKAGHLNLGIPGIMCMGTVGGCMGACVAVESFGGTECLWILVVLFSVLLAAIFAAFGGLIYAFLTVSLRANQNITGLALTTFGAGFADYFIKFTSSESRVDASKLFKTCLPFAEANGKTIINCFFGYSFVAYLAIAMAIITAVILSKTKTGLNLRAIGENPGTADAAGINITKYKYIAIIVGSAIAGLGGLYYVMDYVCGSWENSGTIQAFGWLAIALVIFSIWKPSLAIVGSMLFGVLFVVPSFITGISFGQMKLLRLLPYVVTVIVLIVTSIVGKKETQPPQSLGLNYFREDR